MKRGDMVKVYREWGFHNKRWHYRWFFAKVMVVSDGYAMMRRKGCMPFVESVKDLEKWAKSPPENSTESL